MPTFTPGKYYYISVDILHGTADAELHNPVNLLCGTMAAELDNPVWCMHQESHIFSKENAEKYEGLIQSKILKIQQTQIDSRPSANSWNMYALRRFSKDLKDECFTKTIADLGKLLNDEWF